MQQRNPMFGTYELVSVLGCGGHGHVYLAKDQTLGRQVALKVLHQGARGNRERFEREAAIGARLDHPGICKVFELGANDGLPFVAMQYLEGKTLEAHVAAAVEHVRGGAPYALPLAEAFAATPGSGASGWIPVARFFERIAQPVHAAHLEGVIHRDLKPSNIMVSSDGTPTVIDFGIAQNVEFVGETLTQTGDVLGTPHYLAPEQIEPARGAISPATDIFALGSCLYRALTLELPFRGLTREALYQSVLRSEPRDPRSLQPKVPSELAAIVMRALEKDPARRYPSAAAFAEDLGAFAEGREVAARPLTAFGRTWRHARNRPARAALAAALAMGIPILVGVTSFALQQERDAEQGRLTRATEQASVLLGDGYLQTNEGVPERALGILKEALALEGKPTPEAILGPVMALCSQGRDEEAAALVREQFQSGSMPTWAIRLIRQVHETRQGRILAAVIASDQTPPSTVADHLILGLAALDRGHFGDFPAFLQAQDHLEAAIMLDREANPISFISLLHAIGHVPPTDDSDIISGIVMRRWGDRPEARYYAAIAGAGAHPDRAIELMERVAATDPIPYVRMVLSNAYAAYGLSEKSDVLFEEVFAELPDDPWLLHRLGLLKVQVQGIAQARRLFERALVVDPASPDTHSELVLLALSSGDSQATLDALARAMDSVEIPELATAFGAHRARLGGREADALEQADLAARVQGNDEALRLVSMQLFNGGFLDQGSSVLRRVSRPAPGDDGTWLRVAQTLLQRDQSAEAIDALNRSLRIAPTPSAFSYLASTLEERGLHALSLSMRRGVVRLASRSVLAHAELAQVLLALDAPREALTTLATARALSSSEPGGGAHLRAIDDLAMRAEGQHAELLKLLEESQSSASPTQNAASELRMARFAALEGDQEWACARYAAVHADSAEDAWPLTFGLAAAETALELAARSSASEADDLRSRSCAYLLREVRSWQRALDEGHDLFGLGYLVERWETAPEFEALHAPNASAEEKERLETLWSAVRALADRLRL